MYLRWIKPFLDFIGSLFCLIILSPLYIVCIVLLAVVNKGKIFFIQQRTGKQGKVFNIIKFRTMADRYSPSGLLLPDADRLTSIGKIIRNLSLDEMPQLVNVLKGEMSLVGPRPLLVEYLPLYNQSQKRRHDVKPGITGWAQVNGRNEIRWQEKFAYDVWYVEHVSLLIDIKILLLTVIKVLRAQGIRGENSATMENFKGN